MTDTLKRHHSRTPFDRFGGLTGEARRQEKIRQHALLYGAGPRFFQKEYGLGFLITHQMLEDDMYGQQYVPLSLRSLDAGDRLFMQEMGWTEPQYRLWLREVEREDERLQDQKVATIRDEFAPLRKDQLNRMIDSLVPGQVVGIPAGPPKERTLPIVSIDEMHSSWEYVDSQRDILLKYLDVARTTMVGDPTYHENIRMVRQATTEYLAATDRLLNAAEAIALSRPPLQAANQAAMGVGSGSR